MNHLRELIESIGSSLVRISALPEINSRAQEEIRNTAENSVCFYAGSMNDICDIKPIPELCFLPFEDIWLEGEVSFNNEPGLMGVLASKTDDGMEIIGFGRTPKAKRWFVACIIYNVDLSAEIGESLVNPMATPDQICEGAEFSKTCIAAVSSFCSALHCSNVQQREHLPDARLQNARQKRGKAPLFSYWTLQLNGKNERGEDQGGTHSSPRVHLRRGHPRQFAPGKWTWVQAHAVGNPKLGMVHKDYDTTPLTHRHHQSIEVTQ